MAQSVNKLRAQLAQRIEAWKRGMAVLAEMLAKKDVKLVFRGRECCTTGKTIILPEVSLLAATDDLTAEQVAEREALLDAIQGHLDHEAGHVLFTDFKVKPTYVTNSLEDLRIERKMRKFWPGSQYNLNRASSYVFGKWTEAQVKSLSPVMQVLLGIGFKGRESAEGLHPNYRQNIPAPARRFIESREVQGIIRQVLDAPDTATVEKLGKRLAELLKKWSKEQPKEEPPPQPQPQNQPPQAGGEGEEEDENVQPAPQESGLEDEDDEKPQKKSRKQKKERGEDESSEDEEESKPQKKSRKKAQEDDETPGGGGEAEDGEDEEEDSERGGASGEGEDGEEESEEDDETPGGGAGEADEDEETEEGDEDGASGSEGEADDGSGSEDSGEDGDDEDMEGGTRHVPDGEGGGGQVGEDADPDDADWRKELEQELDQSTEEQMEEKAERIEDGTVLAMQMPTDIDTSEYLVYTTETDYFGPPKSRYGREVQNSEEARAAYAAILDEVGKTTLGVVQRSLRNYLKSRSLVRTVRDLDEGKVDRTRLYRVSLPGDAGRRVFKQTTEQLDLTNVAVALWANQSGSMGGKVDLTKQTIAVFAETLSALNIPFEVCGHTTGYGHDAAERIGALDEKDRVYSRYGSLMVYVYKSFEENWLAVRHRLTMFEAQANTYDGEVVKLAATRMLQLRKEARKVIFLMDDGMPEPNYVDSQARHVQYLRYIVPEVEKTGVEFVGVGMATESVRQFYPHSVVVHDLSTLGEVVLRELRDVLTKPRKTVR